MKRKKWPVQGGGVVGGVCGVILGACVGMGWGGVDGLLVRCLGFGVVFGALGYLYGDRFWRWLSDWIWFL